MNKKRKIDQNENILETGIIQNVKKSFVQEETQPQNDLVNERTVYIQGLPFTATVDVIKEFFNPCGEITSIRLPTWHDSGKLKGYGHIEFKKVKSAQKAMELSGEYIGDRYITVDKPMNPRLSSKTSDTAGEQARKIMKTEKPQGCRKIFIKNLPYDTNEEEITKEFRVYGPIANIRLAVWNHTQNLKGFGYIDFKREDSAEIAVKKSGSILIKGRSIAVDYEVGEPKGSFKGTSVQKNDQKKKKGHLKINK